MYVDHVCYRRHVAGTVPGGAHAELFGKKLGFSHLRHAADLAEIDSEIIDKILGDHELVFVRSAEQFALGEGGAKS